MDLDLSESTAFECVLQRNTLQTTRHLCCHIKSDSVRNCIICILCETIFN